LSVRLSVCGRFIDFIFLFSGLPLAPRAAADISFAQSSFLSRFAPSQSLEASQPDATLRFLLRVYPNSVSLSLFCRTLPRARIGGALCQQRRNIFLASSRTAVSRSANFSASRQIRRYFLLRSNRLAPAMLPLTPRS